MQLQTVSCGMAVGSPFPKTSNGSSALIPLHARPAVQRVPIRPLRRRCLLTRTHIRGTCFSSNRRAIVASQASTDTLSLDEFEEPVGPSPGLQLILDGQRQWEWRGVRVNYSRVDPPQQPAKETPAVVLVHGFGASVGHWRRTVPDLVSAPLSASVFAVDLIGLGASEKPPPEQCPPTIETWAEMLDDFLWEVVRGPAVLVGNSVGSLVALAAAAGCGAERANAGQREALQAAEDSSSPSPSSLSSSSLSSSSSPSWSVAGVVLLNCAGGLNNKAITDDWRIKVVLPIFWLIDALLAVKPIARSIFNAVRTRDNIAQTLKAVYNNKRAVDEELVDIILKPADDEGALDVFVAVISGPPGPRPEALIPSIRAPMLILWGDDDPFTPVDGPVGTYFSRLPETRPGTKFVLLRDVGHCPQDDRHEEVAVELVPWLQSL